MIAIAAFLLGSSIDDRARTLIVFLAVLPLLNAVFDYLSFGVTRLLIQIGVDHRGRGTIFLGLMDFAGAALLFTGLGISIILYFTLLNDLAGAPLVDLQKTLIDIRENPHQYWWLYASLFSTLIPTFAHYALSLFCLIAYVPIGWRARVIEWIKNEKRGDMRRVWAPLALSLFATLAICGPLVILWFSVKLLLAFAPDIGAAYLWMFASFAEWLGAPVQPSLIWV